MIELIKLWFKRAVPNPTNKNQLVQLGVHFEEVAEMADSLNEVALRDSVHHVAEVLKWNDSYSLEFDRQELLDSLCDQIVTAVGVAHMFGMDIEGALAEVNRSNWSKFDQDGQPLFDKNGKIKKGPNYTPPDLSHYVKDDA